MVAAVGAVTAQGPTAADLWDGVVAGRVAIRPVTQLPMAGYRTRLGGEVAGSPLPATAYPAGTGFRDRAVDLALVAAEEAMAAAGLAGHVDPDRFGVVMGTCNAGLLSAQRWYLGSRDGGADPRMLMLVPPQALAEAASAAFGLRGPTLSVNTACASGANAIGLAYDLIRSGQADAVLAGAADAFSDVLFAGFNSLESLSPVPAAPYSKDRQGLSLGEGAGMLVLARADILSATGLPGIAEVRGYGLSADGHHPTAPNPEGTGAARAVVAALRSAGVEPAGVGYVNSHGTGTDKNDPAESRATRLALGAAADRVAVSSTKSMIGHLLGAAGTVEGIVTVKALQEQVVPPTAGFTEADPRCDLDYVPNTARPLAFDAAVSNNFAFGGANASVVFARVGALEQPPPEPLDDPVVVTGVAALTPAGCTPEDAYEAVRSGRDCTSEEDGVRIGRVRLDPELALPPKERRRLDRLGTFAVVASRLALADAGLAVTEAVQDRVGVVFGTALGPMEAMEDFARPLVEEGPAGASPAVFPNTVYNAAAGQVAMRLRTLGVTSTVTAGHAAGASALCYGADLLRADRADAVVCVAADVLTPSVVRAYQELGLLGRGAGTGRQAPALAEAGVALVLERRSAARARGARVLAQLDAHGSASDARGVGRWDPRGGGAERAMRLALSAAGVGVEAVTDVWTGQAGIRGADAAEDRALDRVFGANGHRPRVHAAKRLLGEPLGAGGALGAALAVTGWRRGMPGGPVLVNSPSLGGTHISILLTPAA
jgi:3-oxoacyl-[acyl-carrier-protein] synthase II